MVTVHPETVVDKILSREECRALSGSVFSCSPHKAYQKDCISLAERILAKPIPHLPLTEYLAFTYEGNRSRYETVYFERRSRLLALAMGELAERKGRFLPALMDVFWAILEETSWVIPAHNLCFETNQSVPHEFEQVRHLDLFSATTAADLAVVAWYFEEEFEKRMPKFFMERFRKELERRIFEPYCSDATGTFMNWKGLDGNYVNNWNPWIGLSCSTAALFGAKEEETRRLVCKKALEYVQNFLKYIPENGICLEGPNYHFVSNVAFGDLLELMEQATGGKAGLLAHPMVGKMVCSVKEFYAGNHRFVSIADCGDTKIDENIAKRLYLAGKTFNDYDLLSIAGGVLKNSITQGVDGWLNVSFPVYILKSFSVGPVPCDEPIPLPDECCFNEANGHFYRREGDWYFRFKGGHNHEPHGHNDVGEFLLYYKGKPLLIDPGYETYCADTFSDKRYEQWYISSAWHNVPVINGVLQHGGPQLLNIPLVKAAKDVVADTELGVAQMELSSLYPEESGVVSLVRKVETQGDIIITDQVKLQEEGEYTFSFVSVVEPKVENNQLIFPLEDRELICEFTNGFETTVETRTLTDEIMKNTWEQDKLYRIQIKGSVFNDSFVFQIKR